MTNAELRQWADTLRPTTLAAILAESNEYQWEDLYDAAELALIANVGEQMAASLVRSARYLEAELRSGHPVPGGLD